MEISLSEKNGYNILSLKGEFDMSDSSSFESIINNIKSKSKNIIIDCTDLEYLDSSAIGQLIQLQMDITNNDGKLYIANLNEFILNIFEIADLNTFFTIITNEQMKTIVGD